MSRNLPVALLSEVFPGPGAARRLPARLGAARAGGAELVVLPELPLDRWVAVTREAREDDAEEPGGWRHRALAEAAGEAGVAVLGGAIVRDPESGRRTNRALLHDAAGELVAFHDKLHLPSEDGFWESDHYGPGARPPRPVDGFPLRLGLQICSEANRPLGAHLLAARGAEALLVPRATPPASYGRWKTVFRALAITGACWVVSVNRPPAGGPVPTGGPSLVVDPAGEVVAESRDGLVVAVLDGGRAEAARKGYPGYLGWRAEVFGAAWGALGRG